MKNKLIYILSAALLFTVGVIIYQNYFPGKSSHGNIIDVTNDKQLYTCGMHPEIISDEPGNCPICEMKLTPVKKQTIKKTGEREVLYWVAPMDPNEIYSEPGKSKMGMDLVPVYADEVNKGGVVKIDPAVQQNMNVKITNVTNRKLSPQITTNGIVVIDESREYQITSRVGGWIEKLRVNTVGQKVKKGESLLEIYSPELVAGQEEYLSALRYKKSLEESGSNLSATGDDLIKSSIKKLKLLELGDNEIENIKLSGKTTRTLPILSPANGVVLMKNVIAGEKIKPGDELLHIADLSKLWIIADIYEYELSQVNVGDNVNVSITSLPGKTYTGKVDFIYPVMNNKTRTAKIRIILDNKNGILKPAMIAEIEIKGNEQKTLPVVEEQSVIRSGKKNIVVVSLGEGKFKPVEVTLGNYSDGYYQVTKGLSEGMKIVSSAQFLIDSESSLKSAISSFSSDINSGSEGTNNMDMKNDIKDSSKVKTSEKNKMVMTKENDKTVPDNQYGIKSELIRTEPIDVESIDSNNDGKLFECPMDWDIISDKAGRCPSCQMKLKEYTLDEIKSNLSEFGYKYKSSALHDHGGK